MHDVKDRDLKDLIENLYLEISALISEYQKFKENAIKKTEKCKNTINKLDLICIYKALH